MATVLLKKTCARASLAPATATTNIQDAPFMTPSFLNPPILVPLSSALKGCARRISLRSSAFSAVKVKQINRRRRRGTRRKPEKVGEGDLWEKF
jgi:hypothetical protein